MNRSIGASLWVIVAVAFVLLVLRDVQMDGVLDARSDFQSPTPYFSTLGPPTRSEFVIANSATRFYAEPVYFDFRSPRWFSRAVVVFDWKKDPTLPDPVIGVALDPNPDRLDPALVLLPTRVVSSSTDWNTSEALLPLAAAPRSRYGVRLFFSVPGLDRARPFFLKDVRIRAERRSIWTELKRILSR